MTAKRALWHIGRDGGFLLMLAGLYADSPHAFVGGLSLSLFTLLIFLPGKRGGY